MKSELLKMAFGAAFMASTMTTIVACSQVSENSLLTDQASDPTSHSLTTEPKETELFLKADNKNLGSTTSLRVLELSGDCFASTYPSHKITATVGGVAKAIYNIDSAKSAASCKNGRFNLTLTAAQLATGTNKIILTLTAYDANSVAYTSANGLTEFSVIRSD
ncbi:MAG: hypothetical protein ACKOX6_13845 [Bdellovibrio sp.]